MPLTALPGPTDRIVGLAGNARYATRSSSEVNRVGPAELSAGELPGTLTTEKLQALGAAALRLSGEQPAPDGRAPALTLLVHRRKARSFTGPPGAAFIVAGDLRAAAAGDSSGYPALLVRAGAVAHALRAAATRAGLAAAVDPVPGHRETAAARRLSPGLRHLITVMVTEPEAGDG